FMRGPLATALGADELLVAVSWPRWPAGARWAFAEVARRPGDFALAGAACTVIAGRTRAVVFAVGPLPQLAGDGDFEVTGDLHASAAYRREVTTVEGMGEPGRLTPLQRAFLEHGAFQCGFCTPGFLATGEALLRSGRRLSRAELPDLLAGNLCRCTGYGPIVDAILEAAGKIGRAHV